jgi:molybdate transport system substrate-binding protein
MNLIQRLLAGLAICALTGCDRNPRSSIGPDAAPVELRIAAAADLKFALDSLIDEFRYSHPGIQAGVTYGSSGNFFAQIQNEAPFDLYLSADIEYPRKLAAADLALEGDVFGYAIGRIVVWVPRTSAMEVKELGIRSLLDSSVKKIAIANPQHAPYGKAAVAAMRELGVYDAVQPKLVLGENIAQTAQFIESGAADIGIIALSLALAPEMEARGSHWEIPPESYPKMEQGGMILKSTPSPEAAKALRDFILAAHGRAVLKRYGFHPPEY